MTEAARGSGPDPEPDSDPGRDGGPDPRRRPQSQLQLRPSRRLRLEAALATAAAAGVAAAVGGVVARHAGGRVWQWGAVVAGVLAYQGWFLRRHLRTNRPDPDAVAAGGGSTPAASLCRSIGAANAVTLFRGGLFAATAGFVAVPPTRALAWLPAVCYATGVALDWVDGAVAGSVGRRTDLGARLDLAFDTAGFVVAPVVAVAWGRLPVWYLAVSAARYVFKTARRVRRCRGRPVYDLPPPTIRRPLAGVQMAFVAVALAPVVPVRIVRAAAAVAVVASLSVFLYDYLWITGRVGRHAVTGENSGEHQ